MVEENRGRSQDGLLDDIKRGSRLLEQQLLQFIDWIGDRKVVSFVEMQQTKKLQKVCEIKYIYPAKWAIAAGFPAFIASPSKFRHQKSARKYMQGPVVKAQYPNPPSSLITKKR